jgi:hypothetical protein
MNVLCIVLASTLCAAQLEVSSAKIRIPDTLSIPPLTLDQTRQAKIDAMKTLIQNQHRFHLGVNVGYGPAVNYTPPYNLAYSLMMSEAVRMKSRLPETRASYIVGNMTSLVMQGKTATMQQLEDLYKASAHLIEIPAGLTNWDTDEAFADDKLTFNFLNFKLATQNEIQIPDQKATEITGKTMQQLISSQELYQCDLRIVGTVSKTGSQYTPGAYALYYTKPDGTLMPLAIAVGGSKGLIYYPNDDPTHWRFAKLAFNSATVNYSPTVHFYISHMVFEPMRVILEREVSKLHPLHALLSHHFHDLFGNTYVGLQVLFSKGTPVDQTFGIGTNGNFSLTKEVYDW